MKLSAREEAILAEFVGYYWLLFAMWCEKTAIWQKMPNQSGSNWKTRLPAHARNFKTRLLA